MLKLVLTKEIFKFDGLINEMIQYPKIRIYKDLALVMLGEEWDRIKIKKRGFKKNYIKISN